VVLVARRQHQQHAIIDPLAAQLPGGEYALGKILDGLRGPFANSRERDRKLSVSPAPTLRAKRQRRILAKGKRRQSTAEALSRSWAALRAKLYGHTVTRFQHRIRALMPVASCPSSPTTLYRRRQPERTASGRPRPPASAGPTTGTVGTETLALDPAKRSGRPDPGPAYLPLCSRAGFASALPRRDSDRFSRSRCLRALRWPEAAGLRDTPSAGDCGICAQELTKQAIPVSTLHTRTGRARLRRRRRDGVGGPDAAAAISARNAQRSKLREVNQ
jgi:hypothetical protein